MVRVVVKWNKQSFDCDVDPSLGPEIFKSQLYSLTGVPLERQKLMAKGAWSGVLKDDADMTMMPIVEGQQIMLMGTADTVDAPIAKVAFMEDMTVDEKAEQGVATFPAGLSNLGNTCYMNATLECFRGMTEIRDVLGDITPRSPAAALSSSLRDTLTTMDRSGAAVVPMQFLNMLRTNFPQFAQRGSGPTAGYMQQDAEEFYNVMSHSISSSLGEIGQDFTNYLGLKVEETLTCQETDQETPLVKHDVLNKLVCNIQGGPGSPIMINFINEGLKLGLEGIVEKNSAVLGRNANWKKTQKIAKLPKYICVQFMRFFWKPTPDSRDHQGVKCKILRPVAFSETLDMYEFCTDEVQGILRVNREKKEKLMDEAFSKRMKGEDPTSTPVDSSAPMDTSAPVPETSVSSTEVKAVSTGSTVFQSGLPEDFTGNYELIGVVTHKGRSADSGHYIGWVRQQAGSEFWWKYDDDKVSEVKTPEILDLRGGGDWHTAYLNIYRYKQ